MKTFLLTIALSIPSLSFACVDLSGTYSMCQTGNLGWSQDSEITISQSIDRLKLTRSNGSVEAVSNYFLDGRAIRTVINRNGSPVIVSTKGTCEGSVVKLITFSDSPEFNFSFISFSKDTEGRLSFYEIKDGVYIGDTTCEPMT